MIIKDMLQKQKENKDFKSQKLYEIKLKKKNPIKEKREEQKPRNQKAKDYIIDKSIQKEKERDPCSKKV